MTELVKRAKNFAVCVHSSQRRKHGRRLYIYHPACVYKKLCQYGYSDEHLLSAAWLHDTLEDCNVKYDELVCMFGFRVADLVNEVSHPRVAPSKNRAERWSLYLKHYATASPDGKVLKLVDRICNLEEYLKYWYELTKREIEFVRNIYSCETIDLVNAIGGENKYLCIEINILLRRITSD